MEDRDPKLDKEFLSEIAHANYLQHGPARAMKMLKKDLDKLLSLIDNDGLENLEIVIVAITELFKFGFQKEDIIEYESFARHFKKLIASIMAKNKTLSGDWNMALLRLDSVILHKPRLAEIDSDLPYPGVRDVVKEFRGVIGLAALSVLAAMAIKSVPPPVENSESNQSGIQEISVQMPDMPQKEPGEVTVVSDKNGVYGDRSGVAHEDRVVSNDYGGKEYLDQKKDGSEYKMAVAKFKDKVRESVKKGTLNYEDLFLEGEFVVGDVTKKKHEKALEVAKEIDKDFVDAKNMKPLEFFKKIAEIVQSPENDADYRNKNPYVSDAYSDPERVANCKARTGARGSKIQKYRPDLMKYVIAQKFGDHVRAVVLYEGKLYSMDGSHQADLKLRPRDSKRPNFELLRDPNEVKGSAFMSFEDYFVKKFLNDLWFDKEKVSAYSRDVLKQTGFNPHLIDEHTDVEDNSDQNYQKKDIFGADDAIPGLSNYGGVEETENDTTTVSYSNSEDALKAIKLYLDVSKDSGVPIKFIGGIQFKFKNDVPEWPFILESLPRFPYLKELSFDFEHVADDSMYMVEDENGEHDTLVQGSNPLPAYEKNSAFAEGLATLDGVEALNLSKLKNLSPRLLAGIAQMRSLKELDLIGLDSIPDYFWKMLPKFQNLKGLGLRVADVNSFASTDFKQLKGIGLEELTLSLANVSTVTDWKLLANSLEVLKLSEIVIINSIDGVEKFDEGFVDFLVSRGISGKIYDHQFYPYEIKLSGKYSYSDISEKDFVNIVDNTIVVFANSDVYLAYWKALVKLKGMDKAMDILDPALTGYYEHAINTGKISSIGKVNSITELLNDLGINGEEFLAAHQAWLDANAKKASREPKPVPVPVKIIAPSN